MTLLKEKYKKWYFKKDGEKRILTTKLKRLEAENKELQAKN